MLVHLEQIAAHASVEAFGAPLGAPDGKRAEPPHNPPPTRCREGEPTPQATVGGEELVVERDHRLVATRIALSRAAPEELTVDPACLVALGGDHVKSSEGGDAGSERDVRAAPGHVGCHRDPARLSRPGDDLGFCPILPGVEDTVGQLGRGQERTEMLGGLDRTRAHKDRPAATVDVLDVLNDGGPPRLCGDIYMVGPSLPDERPVGRHADDCEPVDRPELAAHFASGTRHAGEPDVPPEKTLVAD